MQHLAIDQLVHVTGGAAANTEIKTALTSVQSAIKDMAYGKQAADKASSSSTMMMMMMMMRR
ncbi:MAG: hypothetical protein ABI867_02835 [Kofleriaceae bacterium]